MAYDARIYSVFIASPSDVEEERRIITDVLYEWNNRHSEEQRIILQPIKWETHSTPLLDGRPQSIINKDVVDKADCLVGVFWTRVGSPTGIDISGTVEEIKRAKKNGKPVMLYFSKMKVDPELIDIAQIEFLRDFKRGISTEGLYETYATHIELNDKFFRHLESVVRKLRSMDVERKIETEIASSSINASPTTQSAEQGRVDIDALLDIADGKATIDITSLIYRLKELATPNTTKEFVDELRNVLRLDGLSHNDYMSIEIMCRNLGLNDHRIAVLVLASAKYPAVEELKLALVEAYCDSPRDEHKKQGVIEIEKHLNIERVNGAPKLTSLAYNEYAFGLLFNFYFQDNKLEWVKSITQDLKSNGNNSALVLRNYARSLAGLGSEKEAEEAYLHAIELHPEDDTTFVWFGDFLDDLGRYNEAYEYTEKGVLIDPSDPSRYINLAIQILNRGVIRSFDGSLIGPVESKMRMRNALPFFEKALEIGGGRYRERIKSILIRANAKAESEKMFTGKLNSNDIDDSSFKYVIERIGCQNMSGNSEKISVSSKAKRTRTKKKPEQIS